jgi:hypothetical protein
VTTVTGLLVQLGDYRDWLNEFNARFRHVQLKAANAVNTELLQFGNDVEAPQTEQGWGSGHHAVTEQRFDAEISVGEGVFDEQSQIYSAVACFLASPPTWVTACSPIDSHHLGPQLGPHANRLSDSTGCNEMELMTPTCCQILCRTQS